MRHWTQEMRWITNWYNFYCCRCYSGYSHQGELLIDIISTVVDSQPARLLPGRITNWYNFYCCRYFPLNLLMGELLIDIISTVVDLGKITSRSARITNWYNFYCCRSEKVMEVIAWITNWYNFYCCRFFLRRIGGSGNY